MIWPPFMGQSAVVRHLRSRRLAPAPKPHVPLMLHMGLLRCSLFEAKIALTFLTESMGSFGECAIFV